MILFFLKAMRRKVKNQSNQCILPRNEVRSSKKLTKSILKDNFFFITLRLRNRFEKEKNLCKFFDAYKTFDLNFPSPVKHKLINLGIKRKLF